LAGGAPHPGRRRPRHGAGSHGRAARPMSPGRRGVAQAHPGLVQSRLRPRA
jgi:hypothetical protein